jgi:hypothetical protein
MHAEFLWWNLLENGNLEDLKEEERTILRWKVSSIVVTIRGGDN